ncbi:MAG: ribonucleotide-diphosphate reductase subunit beta [Candidatus Sericytochromatia bacterium]|nr:ribonucleotide-diphosphate reductase subunit beta [Candidatus Sericytochromatia bacterium]
MTLRPMRYPQFFQQYRDSQKNLWTTDELDFSIDLTDLRERITAPEAHLIRRLVAFFATADNIVAHNLVLNLYKHVNSPEYRMFLGKQLYDEMLHVETYLLLVDTYISDPEERREAFAAYESIPSVKAKADFAFRYMDSIEKLDVLDTDDKKQQFVINLICFASCIEGLFFFSSFAYVYFLRSKGLLPGLATATNWVFRDESMHLEAAMTVVAELRVEYPALFTPALESTVRQMIGEAIEIELQFADDVLQLGVTGISRGQMADYLRYCADQRLVQLGYAPQYKVGNPFGFMTLQDVQPLTNFFEKRVTEYQKGFEVKLDEMSFSDAF